MLCALINPYVKGKHSDNNYLATVLTKNTEQHQLQEYRPCNANIII